MQGSLLTGGSLLTAHCSLLTCSFACRRCDLHPFRNCHQFPRPDIPFVRCPPPRRTPQREFQFHCCLSADSQWIYPRQDKGRLLDLGVALPRAVDFVSPFVPSSVSLLSAVASSFLVPAANARAVSRVRLACVSCGVLMSFRLWVRNTGGGCMAGLGLWESRM